MSSKKLRLALFSERNTYIFGNKGGAAMLRVSFDGVHVVLTVVPYK